MFVGKRAQPLEIGQRRSDSDVASVDDTGAPAQRGKARYAGSINWKVGIKGGS